VPYFYSLKIKRSTGNEKDSASAMQQFFSAERTTVLQIVDRLIFLSEGSVVTNPATDRSNSVT